MRDMSLIREVWIKLQAHVQVHNKLGYFYVFLIPVIMFIRDSARQGRDSVESGVSRAWATLKRSACALGLCARARLPPGSHRLSSE